MIKLVAIDLDGTLYNSDSKVSPENREAITKCLKKGIKVIITTGKTIYSVSNIIDQLNLVDPQIVSGGAAIIDSNKNILFKLNIPLDLGNEVVLLCRKHKQGLALSAEDGLLYYEKDHPGIDFIAETGDKTVKVDDLIKDNITSKALVFTVPIEAKDEFNQIMEKEFGHKLKLRRGGPVFLNVVNKNAGKAFALNKILEQFGLKSSQVAAIGDSENDLGMLNLAGLAIAMGNAPEAVKVAADTVVSNNDQNGVAEALYKYVLDGSR